MSNKGDAPALGWARKISMDVASGLVLAGVLGVLALLGSMIEPVKQWLLGKVAVPGWGLVVLAAGTVVAGYLVGSRLGTRRGARTDFPVRQSVFRPNDLEERAIMTMRLADGRWVAFALLAKQLSVSSQQDLLQSINRLSNALWIEQGPDNYILQEDERCYRLADAGITYARERGYPTLTELAQRGELNGAGG